MSNGGHDISEAIIRRRYNISLTRLSDAIRLAHATMIFNNSELVPVMLTQISAGKSETDNLNRFQPFQGRLATIVAVALDGSPKS